MLIENFLLLLIFNFNNFYQNRIAYKIIYLNSLIKYCIIFCIAVFIYLADNLKLI